MWFAKLNFLLDFIKFNLKKKKKFGTIRKTATKEYSGNNKFRRWMNKVDFKFFFFMYYEVLTLLKQWKKSLFFDCRRDLVCSVFLLSRCCPLFYSLRCYCNIFGCITLFCKRFYCFDAYYCIKLFNTHLLIRFCLQITKFYYYKSRLEDCTLNKSSTNIKLKICIHWRGRGVWPPRKFSTRLPWINIS